MLVSGWCQPSPQGAWHFYPSNQQDAVCRCGGWGFDVGVDVLVTQPDGRACKNCTTLLEQDAAQQESRARAPQVGAAVRLAVLPDRGSSLPMSLHGKHGKLVGYQPEGTVLFAKVVLDGAEAAHWELVPLACVRLDTGAPSA